VIPRAFSSGSRSVSTPVSARTSEVLPWSMWPAVPRTRRAAAGRAIALAGPNLVEARVGAQRGRDRDRAVGLLVVLEQRDEAARARDRGAVQRGDELGAFAVLAAEADPQRARLVVGAVRGARPLAVLARGAATRHPRLEVELAPGGRAEVARRDLDHAVGDLERLEDLLLDAEQLDVHRLGLLRARDRKELDLRELVHAVEAAALLARGAGLGAEAVRDARHAHGQRRDVEHLVVVEAAESDLRGADQVEVGAGERVDLRLVAARRDGEAVDDLPPRDVGRQVGHVAGADRALEREALERQIEQHGLAAQEVPLLAGDARAALEVEEVEPLADREVVARREVEAPRLAYAAQLAE